MSITSQFSTALNLFRMMGLGLGRDRPAASAPPAPELDRFLEDSGTLPADALLLGVAEDGIPLLLNLYDPAPGSILVTGDRGAGKTGFLQMLACAAERLPGTGDVQFGVISHAPDEWWQFEALPGCMGIWPASHVSAGLYLERLTAWGGHPHNDGRTVVLLLVDGMDSLLLSDAAAGQNLRWLLQHGPQQRIWPVVTFNAGRLPRFTRWMDPFGMFIYGAIRQPNLAEALSGDAHSGLQSLSPGSQFSLLKPEGWLKFWIPSVSMKAGEQ